MKLAQFSIIAKFHLQHNNTVVLIDKMKRKKTSMPRIFPYPLPKIQFNCLYLSEKSHGPLEEEKSA